MSADTYVFAVVVNATLRAMLITPFWSGWSRRKTQFCFLPPIVCFFFSTT